MVESYSSANGRKTSHLGLRTRLCLGSAVLALTALTADPAMAACSSGAPANGATVNCSGADVTGVVANTSTGVTVNVLPDATVIPPTGPAIWLGADAELNLGVRSIIGNEAIASYAVLLGNGATVTLDGTIRGRGGITGPTQVSGSTGLAGAYITLNPGSQIVTNGSAYNTGIDGRAGGNTYLVKGAIRATGTSGQGITPGNGDIITLDTTGSITTLSGDTSNPIDGFGKTGVTVLTGVGSLIELHGIGRGIQLGANADLTLAGTIRSYGDAAGSNSAGGVGVEVGANSTVRVLAGGQIVTGNSGGLGNGGSGGVGISTFAAGVPSNAHVTVDGLIDTQRGNGIFGGIGDMLTVGATGRITTRGTARALFYNTQTSVGNGTLTIDIGGNVEQLGTTNALFISASRAQGETVETPVTANVTIRAGGRLHAAANVAYAQDDGAGTFPEVIDNLVVAGTVSRGGVGVAIGLNDGADRVTFMPTYALIGDVDGGTDAAQAAETDTFALDGGQGTSATFNFGATQMRNFEAGEKLGAGSWTLTGDTSGLNGVFAVKQGMLTVNGVMTGTGVDVSSGAVLGGSGAFTGAGTIANGGILLGSSGSDLGFGSLVLNPTSQVNVTLGAPSKTALFKVDGALTLDGQLNVTNGGGFAFGTYRLFDHGGALTNNGLTIQSLPQGFNPGDWAIGTGTTGQVNLIVAGGPGEQYWDGPNVTPGNIANGQGGSGTWNASSTNWTNQAGNINAPWARGIAVFGPCPGNDCGAGNGAYAVTVDAAGVLARGLRVLGLPLTLSGGPVTLASDARIDVNQSQNGSGSISTAGIIHATGDLIKGGAGSFLSTGQTRVDGGLTVEQGIMSASGVSGAITVGGAVTVGGTGTDTFLTRLVATAGAKLTSAGGSIASAANTASSIFIQFGGSWDAGDNAIDVGASGKGVLRVYSNFANEVSEVKASEIVLGRNAGGNGLLQIWGDDVDAILTTPTIRGGVGGGSVEFDNQSSTTASVFTPLLSGNLSTTFLSGVTTLKGVNNYTGATLINGGKLFLDGASLPGTAVTVQRGTLGGAGTIAGAVSFAATNTILQGSAGKLLNMGSLALGSGTAVNVTLGAPSTSALFNVTGALTLDGLLNVTNGGGFGLGTYRLFDYGGALTNNGLTIQSLPAGFNPGDWAIGTGTMGQVNLIVAAGPGEQYWDGTNLTPGNIANGRGGTGTWNAANTNWTNQAGSINAAWAGQKAVFAKAASNTHGIVTIVGPQAFTGLRFLSGSSYDLVAGAGGTLVTTGGQAIVNVEQAGTHSLIGAPISGAGGINKTGQGELILRGAHSYAGGTTVTAGTLYVGDSYGGAGSIVGSVTTLGAAAANVEGGEIVFVLDSSAGSSSFTNNGVSVTGSRAGLTAFYDDATAANATFVNIGNSVAGGIGGGDFDQPFEYGGATAFYEESNAGNAVITNRGSTIVGAYGGGVGFAESSSAANATITNEGSTTNGAFGGATVFLNESSAGNATLIANGGSGGGGGGGIVFAEEAQGGTATIKLFGNGALDISAHIAPGVTVGSIEGNGLVLLGARTLSVGSNNASTSFSGTMANGGLYGGTGGSLTKLGTGTLTFAGTGAYTGATTVSGGTLLVNGALAATPTTTVASGASLGGSGTIAGATTITNGGALLGTAGADLGLASLALNPASLVNVTLGAPSTSALFNVTGALTLDGLLNVTNGGGFGLGTYRLFDYGGALTNNGLTIQTLPQGFNPGDWAIGTGTTGQVNLIVAAGPGEQYWDGINFTPGNVANGRGGPATWNASSTNWTNQAGSINAPWASGIAVFGPCPNNACTFGSGTSPSYTVTVDAAGVSAKGLRTLNVPVTFAGGKITLADDSRIEVNQPTSSGSGTLNASNVIQATGDLIKGGLGSFFFTGQTLVDGGLTVEQGVMMATEATARLNVAGAITVGGTGTDAFPTRLLASGGARMTSAGGSVGGAANTAGSIFIQRGGTWDAGNNAIDVGASGVGVLRVYNSLITELSEIKASEIVLGRNAGGNGKLQIWGDAGSGIVTAATVRGGVGGGSVEFDNRNSTTYAFAPLMSGNLSASFLSGVTSLHGVNDYSGATLVNGGKLFLDGASLTNSAVTVQRGTLGGAGTITGAVGFAATNTILQGSAGQVLNMGSLTLGSGTAVNVTLGAPSSSALFNVTGALTLDGLLNVTDGGGFTYGAYRLFEHGGALTNNGLTIQTLPAGFNPGDWTIDTATAGRVTLNVVQGNGDQYWDGTNLTPGGVANGRGGSGVWNATNTNWTNQANTINAPWASQNAVFAAAGASTVTIEGAQAVTGMRFLSGSDYRFATSAAGGLVLGGATQVTLDQQGADVTTVRIAAPITGAGALTKSGAGTLILSGASDYAGGTTISAGTLQIGDGGTTGSIAGNIVNNAVLAFDRSDASSLAGSLSGSGSLIKRGAGTLTMTGANSHAGGTTITAGTLQIGNGGTTGSITGNVANQGILAFNRSDATSFGGIVSGSGNLIKAGAGTLTLTGANSLTGVTTVQAGTLLVDGSIAGALSVDAGRVGGAGTIGGNATIGNGATLLGRSGAQLDFGAALALGATSNVDVTLGAPSNTALFDVAGNLTLDGALNVTAGAGFGLGSYRLFDYDGTITDRGLVISSAPVGYNPGDWGIFTATAGQVDLIVAQAAGEQYWDGANLAPGGVANGRGGTGVWNAANTNWTNQANTINAPWAAQRAVFAAAGASTVTIEGAQTVTGMRFLSGANYSLIAGAGGGLTLSGMAQVALEQSGSDTTTARIAAPIGGSGGLVKAGAGTLILTGANSYAGGTTINAGTLRIGDGGTTGSVTGDIANQGVLVFDRSDPFGFGGAITGSGSLVKAGTGAMTLTGAATQGGGTTVSAGTLRIGAGGSLGGNAIVSTGATLAFDRADAITHGGTIGGAGAILKQGAGTLTLSGNSSGFAGTTSVQAGTLDLAGTLGGTLTVASGATLTGAGTASSAVSVGAGGTLSGRSGTTLAMGSLTLTEGAVINAALGAPGGNRLFAVAGNLVLDGTLNVTDAGGYGLGVYRLFDYGGALTDNGLGIGQRPQADGTVTTVQTGQAGQVNLVVEVKTGPDFVQFWNGTTTSPTGNVVGGTGIWTAGPLTNWTNPNGSATYGWNGGFAVFQGTAGTVTAEAGVSTQGMQFAIDGYRLAGVPVTLAAPGMTVIRVGDGSGAGAAWRATVDAALTGTSGLEKQDLGTLILTGTNNYAGGTHIAAGTLSIGNGGTTGSVTGNIANDGALIFNRSNTYDFTGTISGAGTLTKLGAGTLRLGGTHGYTGATLVSAGTLTVDGSIAGSAVTVAAGATLAGTGTVGTTSVAGTIAPGNSPGTLTVAGNYTQLAGSTYAYEPGDLIRVTGTATIQGGRVSAANAAGVTYRLGDRNAILTAAGGRSGPGFAGVDLANPLAQPFLTLALTYDATSVYLQAVRNAMTFESVGGTVNQRAAARGVDGLAATSPLYVAMASIGSAAAARAGFDTLSGEIHATVKGVLLDESRHLREAVANRLDQAGAEGNGIWAHAIGAWGDADSDGNAAALDRSTAGLLLGVDTALGGQWRAGLTGGYSRSKLDVDARASSATVDSVQIGAFAGGRWGGTSLQLGAALAWHDIATRRASGFAGYADTTRGAYDAGGLQVFARAGHVFDLGSATLEPFATIAHARLKTDGFAEQGGTSALSGSKRTDSATWTTLGLRGSVPVGGQASLYGSAAWRHALDGHLPSADLAFGSGTPFRVYGTPLDRDAAALDLGIRFGIGGWGSFAIGYAGTVGSATSDHGVRASMAFRF